MDIKALDKALQEIVNNKLELSKLDYNNPKYDDLEEQLHDLEDDFQDEYGEYLEAEIQNVHDKYCPDNDVLLPIAYLVDGIVVDLEKLPGRDARLILATNPTRMILKLGKETQEVVWTAK
jgi:phosphoglycolate phosphatase-like HAD superfamily hydrolase